jgi:hypothetical protein
MLQSPGALLALGGSALRHTFYCAVFAAALTALMILAARSVMAIRERAGPAGRRVLWLTAAISAYAWVREGPRLVAALAYLRLPHVPAFGEALARDLRGIVGTCLVMLASLALGRTVVAAIRLRPACRLELVLIQLTLGFGVLSMLSLGLAVAGLYRPAAVSLLVVAALASGAVWEFPTAVGARGQDAATLPPLRRPNAIEIAWTVLACAAVAFALVTAFAPEVEYDALWYHLNFPRLWLAAGHPVDVIQEFPSLYPFTWELVFGAGLVFGGPVSAKLLHFACLCLVAAAVALACRRYVRDGSPYVAVALLVMTPTILWEAGTAYNDLGLAMFVSVAVYALARFAETGSRPWFLIAALEFGLAAATKHLALVALAIAATLLAWELWRRRMPAVQILGTTLALVATAVLIAMPWYVRAWHASGNPFCPELYGLFCGGPATRWDGGAERGLAGFKAHFGFHDGLWALLRLPWDVTVHSARFGGSLGPLWLMLVPANLVMGKGDRVTRLLAVAALVYAAVWASPISSYQLRFLIPVVAALALLGARAWQRVTDTAACIGPNVRLATHVSLLAIACLNLPPFTPLHEADRPGRYGWLTHVLRAPPTAVVTGRESEEQFLSREVPSYCAWQYANRHLPPDALVLTFSDGDNFYSERPRIPYDSVLARPAVWTATRDADVTAALVLLGVEYVLFDKLKLAEFADEHLPITGGPVQQACATVYEDRRYRLCRFVPPSVSATSGSGPAGGGV